MASLDTPRLNEAFDLLAHPYRRYVLYHLTNETEVVSIETLATAITGWDGDQTGTARNNAVKTVETALRHIHLPKLADAGIVAFHQEAGTVELAETDGLHRFLVETARIDGRTKTTADD